jgi:hypothetical protein
MPSMADKLGFGPEREVEQIDDNHYAVTVTPPSYMRLSRQSVILTADQHHRYQLWRAGATIQDVLPDLSAAEREILMSGIGDDDFHKMFPEDEE